MVMKIIGKTKLMRLLIPLLAALALPTAVSAGVDPAVHNLCKDVSDYMGCVKANSKKGNWNIFSRKNKAPKPPDFFNDEEIKKFLSINLKKSEKEISQKEIEDYRYGYCESIDLDKGNIKKDLKKYCDEVQKKKLATSVYFDNDDIKRLKEYEIKKGVSRSNYYFYEGFGLWFLNLGKNKVYVLHETIGPAKNAGIKVGDKLIAADDFNFENSINSLDLNDKSSSDEFYDYLANNDSVNFRFKRKDSIIKVKLTKIKYSQEQIKKLKYNFAQGLRYPLGIELDENVLFPKILEKELEPLYSAYKFSIAPVNINTQDIFNFDNSIYSQTLDNSNIFREDLDTIITKKGIKLVASRSCAEGEKMRWKKVKRFLTKTKYVELGCMTDKEEEGYWREYEMRKATQPNINIQNNTNYVPRSAPVNCYGSSYGNSASFSCY